MTNHEEAHFGRRRVTGPVSDIPVASRLLSLAEDTDARRRGFTVQEARQRIARVLKVPARTLLHIRNQRRKSVPQFLMSGIRDILIDVLQAEIRSLEHEIHIARQIGMDGREDAFLEAAASIEIARKILEGAVRSDGGQRPQRKVA